MNLDGNSSLLVFKKKIEEAVVLVPSMSAEAKLNAVQFWNVFSERLQEIVNNSAADINALAMRMEEENQKQATATVTENQKLPKTAPQPNEISRSLDRQTMFQKNQTSNSGGYFTILNNSEQYQEKRTQGTFSTESRSNHHLPASKTANEQITNLSPMIYSEQELLQEPQESQISRLSLSNGFFMEKNQSSVTSECQTSVINQQGRRNVIQSTSAHINQESLSERSEMTENFLDESSEKLEDSNESDQNSTSVEKLIANGFDVSEFSNDSVNASFDDPTSESNFQIEDFSKTKTKKIKKADLKAKEFQCDVCQKVLPTNSALVSHRWVHTKPYTCTECNSRFSTKGNLLVHQRRHTGEKPFACDHPGCLACFSTKGNLKRHFKAHSGERPWKCSQCDSSFTEKKSLKVHMRRHTGEKPYSCSVCGKSFSQTGVLQTHMALHLDERKHLCELCGKAFRQRSQLRLHVLRHEGVKKWNCTVCSARFLTKGDLERHYRVHTGERPFVCDICGKTFTRQQSLNEHSNRHYGLKPYSCTVCSKTFAEMSACYKHIKVHKKQENLAISLEKSSKKSSNIKASVNSHVNVIKTRNGTEHSNSELSKNDNESDSSVPMDSVLDVDSVDFATFQNSY